MRRAAVGFGARLAALVLSAAVFSGCATPGKLKITPLWAPKLTTDEQREAQIIEDAFARFVANERAHGAAGLELPRILIGGGAPASYTQGYILLPRRALSGGPDHMNVRLYWHIIISHEGGHLYYTDARDCPVRQKARCEWNANAEAVGILNRGFGYSWGMSVQMVHLYLTDGVLHGKPSVGHEDACAETHDFERRLGLPLDPCAEKVADDEYPRATPGPRATNTQSGAVGRACRGCPADLC
jgi:hypothetical protein